MNEELVAQFVEQVKADCGDSGFCGASGDAEGMLQLELTVHENLMRLGRGTVRRLVQEIGTGHLGSEVNHEGQAYRFKGYRPKTVHGLYGAVRILRAYYATGSGSGWAPLDEQLGIGDGQTPGCAYHLALFVGSEPYQSGRSHFHQIFRPDGKDKISLHKSEQMIDALGCRLEQQRQQEIVAHFEPGAASRNVEVTAEITGTMVVCIDAGKAPIKGNERVDNANRRRYDREFRDVKVASISALGWDGSRRQARCTDTTYVGGIEHADEFFRRVWVEMNRRCRDLSKLCLVFIGDGAEWIWQRIAELDNESSCRILDFCHAAEHLADLCKLLDGEGSERYRERFRRWRAQLGASGPGQLLTEIQQERDAAVGSAKRDDIQAEINYFEANRQRMNYPLYRDDGLPIGSGAVQSACKNVAARMKRSGTTWTLSGAKHLLQLRVSMMSSRFDRDFRQSLPALPNLHDLQAAA